MKDGIININKPQNMTSFDVVAIVRKTLGIKRVGHLGTLDPMATGVLPVAVGNATRIMEYLDGDIKEYIGEFKFGLRTDTDDIWGQKLEDYKSDSEKLQNLSSQDIEEKLQKYLGVIEQVPPIYSALKMDGKKLYEYAREGQSVEIKPRRRYIEKVRLLDYDEEQLVGKFQIRCSKGTYIRSLARDLGDDLGVGAVMSALVRTKTGAFSIEEALDGSGLKGMTSNELSTNIEGMDKALPDFGSAILNERSRALFANGVVLRKDQWQKDSEPEVSLRDFPLELPDYYGESYRVYCNRQFIGMGRTTGGGGLKADKVLVR